MPFHPDNVPGLNCPNFGLEVYKKIFYKRAKKFFARGLIVSNFMFGNRKQAQKVSQTEGFFWLSHLFSTSRGSIMA